MGSKKQYRDDALEVAELFAGVGGFRLGLEKVRDKNKGIYFKTIFANQWEPASKNSQHAAWVYKARFGDEGFICEDIAELTKDVNGNIGDHDILVGGFPCQDYSVAKTLGQASGIIGKKGVLWWQIHKILEDKKKKPKYLILENVDRLLKSPANQRGRDFAIMLRSLWDLGYAIEWRVVNAAEYGYKQRRRRVFIVGYYNGTKPYKLIKDAYKKESITEWVVKNGLFAEAFPIHKKQVGWGKEVVIGEQKYCDLPELSKSFDYGNGLSPFLSSGVVFNGTVFTAKTKPRAFKEGTLRSCLQRKKVPGEYWITDPKEIKKWEDLKGSKKVPRIDKKTNHTYFYSEGSMACPDELDRASRTIVTGEGGSTPSRFKHIIKLNGRYRRLTPYELEKLNGFSGRHTELRGVSDIKRAFFMGNALVVGVVTRIGKALIKMTSD